ncbi:MAG: hypothetical protein JO340_15430 [Acidobacteriaceae bacterium]|nr:hypothetical protein [Acidobacteriaceae bacterium]
MPETIHTVLKSELDALTERRKELFRNGKTNEEGREELQQTLFGICLSGGGIRSATFNLGILQGLAGQGLLKCADYLSTVSGGGYIGSWFHGIVKRASYGNLTDVSGKHFHDYESFLANEDTKPGDTFTDPIAFLRSYSNYLAPQLGLLSADTWVIATIYLRNTILNQLILYLALASVLLVPVLLGTFARLAEPAVSMSFWSPLAFAVLSFALLFGVVWRVGQNLRPIAAREFNIPLKGDSPDNDSSAWWTIVAPLWALSIVVSFLIGTSTFDPSDPFTALIVFLALALLFGLSLSHNGYWICYRTRHGTTVLAKWKRFLLAAAIVLLCSVFTLVLLILEQKLLFYLAHTQMTCSFGALHFGPTPLGMWQCLSWGPILITGALASGNALQTGLMGVDFPDAAREWYSRLAAKLVILSFSWGAWFAISIFAPTGVICLFEQLEAVGIAAVMGWIATTVAGVVSGKSPATVGQTVSSDPSQQASNSSTLETVAKYAPPIALAGILIALSTLAFVSVNELLAKHSDIASQTVALSLNLSGAIYLLIAELVMFAAAFWLSRRININEFSMNHFYKNRLVRCYLGASHIDERHANRFTGFDPQDDISLAHLVPGRNYPGPFAIINCTLNLNHGAKLAWQERKAASFVFTPKYCGYDPGNPNPRGFVETTDFAYKDGPHLGLATSISGAAVNPNWGFHTAPATAFLLTLFNVRLGWWIGNTRFPDSAKTPGPSFALKYLIYELLGQTTEQSKYLNLSDGGHFENLGLYELVRRKCRFVVVGDGEQDEIYQFESLGGAIRKIRIDLGHSIEISPKRIFLESGVSAVHCALGKIKYNDGTHGVLLYLKASLTGDETYDVTQYKKSDPAFPHDSTANQFFTESRFESYRALGKHIVEKVFLRIPHAESPADLERIFCLLNQYWALPASAGPGVFTKHASAYSALINRLAANKHLRFLDPEILPGFAGDATPPANSEEMREAKLLVTSFLQLMEDVYIDLSLEDEDQFKQQANAGWIRLFGHWKSSPTFKTVWETVGHTYGQGFRRFYDRLCANAKESTLDCDGISATPNRNVK